MTLKVKLLNGLEVYIEATPEEVLAIAGTVPGSNSLLGIFKVIKQVAKDAV